jgi:hypothetical protein
MTTDGMKFVPLSERDGMTLQRIKIGLTVCESDGTLLQGDYGEIVFVTQIAPGYHLLIEVKDDPEDGPQVRVNIMDRPRAHMRQLIRHACDDYQTFWDDLGVGRRSDARVEGLTLRERTAFLADQQAYHARDRTKYPQLHLW